MAGKPIRLSTYRAALLRIFTTCDEGKYLMVPLTCRSVSSINFSDSHAAFNQRSLWELARALIVLKMSSYDKLVDNAPQLMVTGQRFLGNTLFNQAMKLTFYGQFVAGEDAVTSKATIARLQQAGIEPMIMVPMEENMETVLSEKFHDENLQDVLDYVRISSELGAPYPMIHMKLSSVIPVKLTIRLSSVCRWGTRDSEGRVLLEHLSTVLTGQTQADVDGLSTDENEAITRAMRRLKAIGQSARERNVIVLIDAEFISLTPAQNLVTLVMMVNFNQEKPLFAFTYQNYLKETFDRLQSDVGFIEKKEVCFAAKLVRGAYMDAERGLAKHGGYDDPIHPTFEETSNMYHRSLNKMLEEVVRRKDQCRVMIASHNEQTVNRAINRIEELGIDTKKGFVFFGQTMGIADHVSYSLGRAGHMAYQSLPIGSISSTLPYLARRAQENRAVLRGSKRTRALLWKAVKTRLFPFYRDKAEMN